MPGGSEAEGLWQRIDGMKGMLIRTSTRPPLKSCVVTSLCRNVGIAVLLSTDVYTTFVYISKTGGWLKILKDLSQRGYVRWSFGKAPKRLTYPHDHRIFMMIA